MGLSTGCWRVLLGLVLCGMAGFLGVPSWVAEFDQHGGSLQHFRSAIMDAWRDKVLGQICMRKGFWGGPSLIFTVLCTSLTPPMFWSETNPS